MAHKGQKKNAKGRLDRYYYLAKEKGYRARSAFKILQINSKYNDFLSKSRVVIDLCAAPGSWCQVASQLCRPNSLIVGVDIVAIKPMKNVTFIKSDITSQDCKSQLAGFLKTVKADVVLHDGAPNVGLNWYQDAYQQSILTLSALRLATEHLNQGGYFITKIFRSKDYNKLMWIFNQLFEKVEATKPPSSRNVSAEIFVFCKGFKAPRKIDPKLLDPKEVFEELPDGKQNMEAKVFNPDKKVRKRDGYEEGDYLLFHSTDIMDLVKTETPIDLLGSMNQFTFDKENNDWKLLKKMKETDTEFLECIKDLKVLGRKEFKSILRWRRKARDLLEIGVEKEDDLKDKVEVTPLTQDERIDKELQELTEKQRKNQKREKKRANEIKQKEILRMQMDMITDKNIGIEAADNGSETLFNLQTVKKAGVLDEIRKGKKRMIFKDNEEDTGIYHDDEFGGLKNEDSDLDELDDLEDQLNSMHDQYKERVMERDVNAKAKFAREGDDEEEWAGIEDREDKIISDGGEDYELDEDSESDSDDNEDVMQIIQKREKIKPGLSERAKMLFGDPLFEETQILVEDEKVVKKRKLTSEKKAKPAPDDDSITDEELESGDESNGKIEFVKKEQEYGDDSDSDSGFESDNEPKKGKPHQVKVDIATVEAMTLAHQLALGHKSKHDVVDEGFNKYSFRDQDGLPDWFLEEERQHSKIAKPITKEAAFAIKEKMKQLNARPIKKVLEAQGRKKLRALRRIEKLKKKSEAINENSGLSEKDKADEISKLSSRMGSIKAGKTQRPKVTLVVAKGSNKGLSGRPRGVKGKYKMVDGVMKNELRALKRISKKKKGKH